MFKNFINPGLELATNVFPKLLYSYVFIEVLEYLPLLSFVCSLISSGTNIAVVLFNNEFVPATVVPISWITKLIYGRSDNIGNLIFLLSVFWSLELVIILKFVSFKLCKVSKSKYILGRISCINSIDTISFTLIKKCANSDCPENPPVSDVGAKLTV